MISAVVPVFNERDRIGPLLEELMRALESQAEPFEIIYVDDGSTDGSHVTLSNARAAEPRLRVVTHRTNFGQSAALLSGIRAAQGELVVTLDGDGQDDPAELGKLLPHMRDDVACVCAVRAQRRDSWIRRLGSRAGNGIRRVVMGDDFSDTGCNFRVLRTSALRDTPLIEGINRLLPSLLEARGYRVLEVPVEHRSRMSGATRYGLLRLAAAGLVDLLGYRWLATRAIPADREAHRNGGV